MQATAAPTRSGSLATLVILALSAPCLAQISFRLGDQQPDADRLEHALAERGSLEVLDTPLNDVVEKLSTQFRVPIVLSPRKLEEAGINVDTRVTKHVQSLPLESILDILLRELELDFTIHNHVILVSTPEHIESPEMMEMRIYPVRDLVLRSVPGAKDDSPSAIADYDALIDVITTSVAPEGWTDVGGPASIREFDNSAALVVSSTRRVHRQIEQLLATLRKVKELQGTASLPESTSTSLRASKRIAGRTPSRPSKRLAADAAYSWQVPQVHGGE